MVRKNYSYWQEDGRQKKSVTVRCLYEVDYLIDLLKDAAEAAWKAEAKESGKSVSDVGAYYPSQVMEDVINDVYELYKNPGFEIIFSSVLSSSNCKLTDSVFVLPGDEAKAHGMHKPTWDIGEETAARYLELYSDIARYEYEGQRFTRGYFFRLVTRVAVLIHSGREDLLELKNDSPLARKALSSAIKNMPKWPELVAAYAKKEDESEVEDENANESEGN